MPRRVAVLVNRNAPGAIPRILAALRAALPAADLHVTSNLDDARAALDSLAAGDTLRDGGALLFGGGDGTLVQGLALLSAACAAAGLPEPPVGVLRLGTGNAFADATGAGPGTVAGVLADLRRAAAPNTSGMPDTTAAPTLATVEALGLRAPFCGFGVDAQLLEDQAEIGSRLASVPLLGRAARRPGLRYGLSVAFRSIPRFLFADRPTVTVHNLGSPAIPLTGVAGHEGPTISPAGATLWTGACTLAACATIRYFGLGLQMFAFADRRADRFQLRAADPDAAEILRSTPAAFRGTYVSPRVHDFFCDRVALSLSRPAPFEIGGELVGRHQRVEVALGRPLRLAYSCSPQGR